MKQIFTIFAMLLTLSSFGQAVFPALDTNFTTRTVLVASNLSFTPLFEGNRDFVWNGTEYAIAKQNHDFTGLLPLGTGNDSCLLIVNHEVTNTKNPKLGDGGGMTVFRVNKVNGVWQVVNHRGQKFWNVDFKTVGGTNINCGGITLSNGNFMTAEEFPQESNSGLFGGGNGVSDTSDYTIPSGPYQGKVIKRWQNYGWMVEVDAANAKAVQKSYAMGRFSHEGGWAMPDKKTVYLTDDYIPGSCLFKFVADKENDYSQGTLSAYKHSADGNSGQWVEIERNLDTLLNARNVAWRKGATIFNRLEWVVDHKGKLYLTETGIDQLSLKPAKAIGGTVPKHLERLDTLYASTKNDTLLDYYGRILRLDLNTLKLDVYLEGGNGASTRMNFSNPDGLAIQTIGNKTYLMINEDLNGGTFNRSGNGTAGLVGEIFAIDLDNQSPKVDDLRRFLITPQGSESTGGVATPDGKTYFVNIQHPSSSNNTPFNNSITIAVTGFSLSTSSKEIKVTEDFSVFPNPAQDVINFNKVTDVSLYNITGQQIRVVRNANSINVGDLTPGVYFLQTIKGAVVKVVKQ